MTFGKSKTEAEQEPNRAGGGGDFIRYLKEGSTTVRILQEQNEWKYYWEHFHHDGYSFPCSNQPDCHGCTSENEKTSKVSRKIAFNALSSFNGTEYVDVWKIGPMVSEKLENRIQRNGTITDRDYTLTKYKTSADRWDFDVEGGAIVPVDLHKEQWKDIEAMLQQAWDDSLPGAPRPSRDAWNPTPGRMAISPTQPEEPPFEEKVYKEADLRAMDYEDLLVVIKTNMDADPPSSLTTTKDVVDWLMNLQS